VVCNRSDVAKRRHEVAVSPDPDPDPDRDPDRDPCNPVSLR
jgi:hypothetical protein